MYRSTCLIFGSLVELPIYVKYLSEVINNDIIHNVTIVTSKQNWFAKSQMTMVLSCQPVSLDLYYKLIHGL